MGKKQGFTLIELLVVIAIIALLMAIIMPALGKAKEQAGLIRCANRQRQIITGVNAYATDWNGSLPYKASGARPSVLYRRPNTDSSTENGVRAVYTSLGSYLPEAEVFNCPLSSFEKAQYQGNSYQDLYQDTELCRSLGNTFSLNCSYQLLWNTKFGGWDNAGNAKVFSGPGKDSHNKLLIADVFLYSNNLNAGGTVPPQHWASTHKIRGAYKERGSEGMMPYYYLSGSNEDEVSTVPSLRSVRLNAGYLDGRVDRFLSGDSYKMQAVLNYAAFRLPEIWY